ncbi:MAG: hypothetical protein JWO26_2217 [Rhodospirillales bacterium]|nr:hypothetical protein [Rhodospirillales bacterium]
MMAPEREYRAGLGAAWFVTIVVFVGAVAGIVTQREALVAAWPPAAHAFAALGLR